MRSFDNNGQIRLHEHLVKPDQEVARTIVVSGVGRSGTSMVAAILSHIGIDMGRTDGLATHEDQDLQPALTFHNGAGLLKIIESRDSRSLVWGFKFPSIQNHLFPSQLRQFRGPRLIIISRDPVAVASRAVLSDPGLENATRAILNVAKQMSDLAEFVIAAGVPTLMLSYEKAIQRPLDTVKALAEFCGVDASTEVVETAARQVDPNNVAYLKEFHPAYEGYFDGVSGGHIVGWCRPSGGRGPVEVRAVYEGRLIARGRSDLYREDLKKAGFGDGCWGFQLSLDDEIAEVSELRIEVDDGHFTIFKGHLCASTGST